MAAVDTVLLVEKRLWTLVLNWVPFTSSVLPLNRLRYDDPTIPWPQNIAVSLPADAPQVELEVMASRPDPKAPRTLCFQPDINIVTFEWTLIGSDQTYNALTQLLAEIKACMKDAGTQLGIPATIAKWEWEWKASPPKPDDAGDLRRQIKIAQKITIKG